MTTASMAWRGLKSATLLMFTAYREWIRDRCEGLAAAMAFNLLLAMAPFVAGMSVVAVSIFGGPWTRVYVAPGMEAWLGPRGLAMVQSVLLERRGIELSDLVSLSVVSAIALLYGSSAFFWQLQDSLEIVWDVRREAAEVQARLHKRVFGLGIATITAIIVLAGLMGTSIVIPPDRAQANLGQMLAEASVAFLTFWVLATFWFKALPPVRLTLRQILPWSALAGVMHLLGRMVVTWRAAGQTAGSDTATVESLILIILWFQFASMAFLYVAELMRLHLQRRGNVAMRAAR